VSKDISNSHLTSVSSNDETNGESNDVNEQASSKEADVAQYLKQHPDFLTKHKDVLSEIELAHAGSGNAVSLIERQLRTLREKNSKLENTLAEFIDVARANDQLIEKIHRLSVKLIKARHLPGVFSVIESSLRADFGVDVFSLLVYRDVTHSNITALSGKFGRDVQRDDQEFQDLFSDVLKDSVPRCGHLKTSQRDYLFKERIGQDVKSAALLPLGRDGEVGLLAFGSFDMHHFNPAASTDFLKRIGELVSQVITTQ